MTEYSKLAKGTFTSTGSAQIVNLPFLPGFIELINYSAAATPAQHGIPFAWWSAQMGQGYAVCEIFNATPVLTTGVVTTNGFSTFTAGQLLQFGPVYQHTGSTDFSMTAANPIQVTTTTNHGLTSGQVVIFQNLAETITTGMQQICGIPFVVTVTGATTFTIPWNATGSNYTAFNTATSTNNAGSWKQVLYPYLYAPGVSIITAITTGTTTTVTTTTPNNFVVGQQVAFRIPAAWGPYQLNSLPDPTIPGSPIYGYVVSVTNSTQFVVNINSTGYTAFNPNQPVNSVPGLTFPQVLAVGDVNSGGVQISSGSALYPPPVVNGFNTINGPAIQGAFVNNTSQGFIVGAGATTADASSVLVGSNGNVIYWRAFAHDISLPS
jgi:hypothetical protein